MLMRTTRRIALLLLAVTPGCSTVAPPRLDGSPEKSALVLVECDVQSVQTAFNTHTQIGGVEGLLGGAGNPPAAHQGSAIDSGGLVVFSNVEPGRWTLTSLRAAFRSTASTSLTTNALAANGMPEKLTINARAGEPIYLGVVRVDEIFHGISKAEVHVALEASAQAESAAWNRFLQTYKDSAWDEPIRKRMASLAAGGR